MLSKFVRVFFAWPTLLLEWGLLYGTLHQVIACRNLLGLYYMALSFLSILAFIGAASLSIAWAKLSVEELRTASKSYLAPRKWYFIPRKLRLALSSLVLIILVAANHWLLGFASGLFIISYVFLIFGAQTLREEASARLVPPVPPISDLSFLDTKPLSGHYTT